MKKTYRKPQAQAVSLFTEEALLSLSNEGLTVDPSKNTDTQFSNTKGWSSDNWSATDED